METVNGNKRAFGAVAAGLLLIGAVVAGTAIAYSNDEPGGPGEDKTGLPRNINPNKQPILDPPTVAPEPAPTLAEAQKLARKTVEEVLADPWTTICLTKDNTLAGEMGMDAPSDADPPTYAEKMEMCAQSFSGSHPPDKAYIDSLGGILKPGN